MRAYLASFIYTQPEPSTTHGQLVVQLTQDGGATDATSRHPASGDARYATIDRILALDDLYEVLGLQKSPKIDAATLRRAYLLRSRACHPEFVSSPFCFSYPLTVKQQIRRLPRRCDPGVQEGQRSVRGPVQAILATSVRLARGRRSAPEPLRHPPGRRDFQRRPVFCVL